MLRSSAWFGEVVVVVVGGGMMVGGGMVVCLLLLLLWSWAAWVLGAGSLMVMTSFAVGLLQPVPTWV